MTDELRLHGMSGTPPKALLYSDPVTYDRSDSKTKVWEQNRDERPNAPFHVRAFHWGSLTSGSKVTAFWILLVPFLFANVAGWMADGRRWTQAWIRLAGLCVTGLFIAQLGVVFLDLAPTWLINAGMVPGHALALGAAVLGVVFVGITMFLSTRSSIQSISTLDQIKLLMSPSRSGTLPPGMNLSNDQTEDPAPRAKLTDAAMWERHSILHRLRRLHFGAALALIAVSLEWGIEGLGGPTQALAVGVLAAVVLAVLFSSTNWVFFIIRWAGIAGVLVWLAAIAHVFLVLTGTAANALDKSHTIVFFVALGLGVAVFMAFVSQTVVSGFKTDSNPLLPTGAFAFAGLLGGAMGVALGLLAEFAIFRFGGDANPFQVGADPFVIANAEVMVNGGSWVAAAMLVLVLAFIAAAGIAALWPPFGLPTAGRTNALLRKITQRAPWVFGGAAAVALVLGGLAIVNTCLSGDCDPSKLAVFDDDRWLPIAMTVIAMIGAAALSIAATRISGGLGVGTAIVTAGLIWLVNDPRFDAWTFELPIIRIPINPTEVVDLSILTMILGLTFLIFKSIVGGFGSQDSRRQVGMLWDTGSFWPRWFHPLAPPAYGPHAVQALREQLGEDEPDLLTAHSQGSVVATVALADGGVSASLIKGYVTYGSPMGILYKQMFPAAGVAELAHVVECSLSTVNSEEQRIGHWINLWRDTDPLGGEEVPISEMAQRALLVDSDPTEGNGHSQYELTEAFFNARPDAITGVATDANCDEAADG